MDAGRLGCDGQAPWTAPPSFGMMTAVAANQPGSRVPPNRPPHFYRQSAVVPFRRRVDVVEVLLITTRKRRRWIVPKGIVEPGLSAADSAVAEAYEEAGVRGALFGGPLGAYAYRKWGGTCTVEVFALEVDEECGDWPECAVRTRRWAPLADAADAANEAALGDLIRRLGRRLEGVEDGA